MPGTVGTQVVEVHLVRGYAPVSEREARRDDLVAAGHADAEVLQHRVIERGDLEIGGLGINEDVAGAVIGVARQEARLAVDHPEDHVAGAALDEALPGPALEVGKPDVAEVGVELGREDRGDLVVEAFPGLVRVGKIVRVGADLELPAACGNRGGQGQAEKEGDGQSSRSGRARIQGQRPLGRCQAEGTRRAGEVAAAWRLARETPSNQLITQ